MSWKSAIENKTAEKLERSYITVSQSEYFDESPAMSSSLSKKDFLKRSSKSIKPQKIKWKAERRIDCWLSRDNNPPKDLDIDLQVIKEDPNILHLDQLEEIFLEMSTSFVNIAEFFSQPDRSDQKIPVLSISSKFVTDFSEEKHQETIEDLENYYSALCNDEAAIS